MDSSSTSPTFASRDGSPAEEDDGSLSFAAGLAKEAALLFQGGKLLDCLKILKQLLNYKEADPKVQHNIAIVENLQAGCVDPTRLVEALVSIKKQVEELSHASRKQLDGSGDVGNKATAGMEGSNSATRQLSRSAVCSTEFDTTVTVFNIGVILFHLHQYAKSFSYLDTLYQNIGPIDELQGTTLRVCLLLLDVALLSHHPSRFADMIRYIERVFLVNSLNNQVEKGTFTQRKPLLVSKSSSLPSNSTIHDASHSDSVATANTLENFNSLTRSLSDEALEDESSQLLSPLNNVNIERLTNIASYNDLLKTQEEESSSDLRLKLHLYKTRFFLLVRDFKEARHELKLAMSTTHEKDHPLAICLKSQLEYASGNFDEASRVLKESNNWKDPDNPSMFWNNLGCIDYRLGNFNSSGAYFLRALESSSHKLKEKPRKLLTISKDKSHLITYNCGLNSLACGKPINAAWCFYKATLLFDTSPLLWLRMAECCLMALEKGLSDIRVNVIGRGKWRYLALECERMPSGGDRYVKVDDKLSLSMPFARKCLVNVLFLLDYPEGLSSISRPGSPPSSGADESNRDSKALNISSGSNGEVREQNGGNYENGAFQHSLSEYEYICLKEKHLIKEAALADLAYVELELENYTKALSWARSLLELPDCLKVYVFLGTMYMTEALCMLNRHEEAASCLMKFVSNGNADFPYNQEDYEKLFVKKVGHSEGLNGGLEDNELWASVLTRPEQARGIFHANYAANLVLRGDFEQAHQCVTKALSDIPNCSKAVLTAIYLDLKRGYTKEAVDRLKQHKCVAFVKGGLPSNAFS